MILYNERIIKHFKEAGAWADTTLVDCFERNVENSSCEICLVDPLDKLKLVGLSPQRVTYQQLDQKVRTLATNLVKTGLQKDDIVVVQLPNISELVMAYLAITLAGAVISPVPMQWRRKELGYIFKLTRSKMYIGLDDFKGFSSVKMVQQLREESTGPEFIISLPELLKFTEGNIDEHDLKKRRPKAVDVFTIQWTSGTEADSKGCPLTHNNQLFQGSCYQALGLNNGSTILCLPPLVNASGISSFLCPGCCWGESLYCTTLLNPVQPQRRICHQAGIRGQDVHRRSFGMEQKG